MSPFLEILKDEVQLAALVFMASVYALRVAWLFRFPPRRERTRPAGRAAAGAAYSLINIANPGGMESTRKRPWFYFQFVVFHIGVAAAISATFLIPYAPVILENAFLAWTFTVLMASAFLVGMVRLYRRLTTPVLRMVSTPDDFASLILMIVYFASGILALSPLADRSEWPLILFFSLTTFFLVYVPFSKIGHYLYYPFARIYLGRTLGHRGAWPPQGRSRRGGAR